MNWKLNWLQRLILITYAAGIILIVSSWDYNCTNDARQFDAQPYRPYATYLAAYITAAASAIIAASSRKIKNQNRPTNLQKPKPQQNKTA
jgi:hypothetical protein